ncbi:guanylate kinase [Gammaproteobacteria bacterium SCGC AG-212-F23]|nr:guanylate kinase [Gammaproteobacteria bacterium SCGC AG-212-F23]
MKKCTGNLYVISAPSGTGKTTLVKALVDSTPDITVSISHTTRPRRPAETDGVNYYFIERNQFEKMIEHHDFLEYAHVFGHLYGTSHTWVEETLKQGKDVILEIDWQGAQQIQTLFTKSISIFILPPSLKCLHERLLSRKQDNIDIIQQRIADVREAVSHAHEYNYIVMNDDFETAMQDLKAIVRAGQLLERRQVVNYASLITDLIKAKL